MKRLFVGWLVLAATLAAAPSPGVAEVVMCGGLPATLVGTPGDDVIVGTNGPDVIAALDGADEVHGGIGDDTICGGNGRDVLDGGSGDDTIRGGSGADTIRGDYSIVDLSGFPSNDWISGGPGRDRIWAGPGNDVVYGGGGNDVIHGNGGEDRMFGNSRADRLVGGPGDDVARGGRGIDKCAAERARCEAAIAQFGFTSVDVNATTATVSGTITHTEPILFVDFALFARPEYQWVQLDGSLGTEKAWRSGVLASSGAMVSDWSAEVDLAEAQYSMTVRAGDADGDIGKLHPWLKFAIPVPRLAVGTPITDSIYHYEDLKPLPHGTALGRSPRDIRVDAIPEDGTGPVVRLSGSLLGLIGGVQVAVRDGATGLWLQANGTFGLPAVRHWVRCPNCNDTRDVYWLFDAELADGDYTLDAFAVYEYDHSVVAQLESRWGFTVDGAVVSTPQVAVDQASGVEFSSTPFSFTGVAEDDIGVDWVHISVRNAATGLWLQNSTGSPVWDTRKEEFEATLSDRNASTTDWAVEFDLPPGDYRLSVGVRDEVLHRNSIRPWLPFRVTAPGP